MLPMAEEYPRLRRLWDEHRRVPFPDRGDEDARLQEVALYESWLGSLVDLALARGGRLTAAQRRLVMVREEEGNQAIWSLAGDLGEPVRSYVARLIALENLLLGLPAAED